MPKNSSERKLFRLLRPARFASVGAFCAVVQLGLLAAFNEGTGLGSLSNALAFLISAQLNFGLNAAVTWRDRMRRRPRALVGQLLWFNTLIFVAVGFNQAVYLAVLSVAPYLVAGAAGIGATTLAKYFVANRWIFPASALQGSGAELRGRGIRARRSAVPLPNFGQQHEREDAE